jgi:hypothetical protein
MKRLLAVAAVAVLAAVAPACGSDGDDDAAPETTTTTRSPTEAAEAVAGTIPVPTRPTCQLLTRQEVAGVLGNAVHQGTGVERDCFWGTEVDGGTSANVAVAKYVPGQARAECDLQRSVLPKDLPHESVGGIGIFAVWLPEQVAILTQGRLLACWDDAVVNVNVSGERPQQELRGVAVTLAERARSRI